MSGVFIGLCREGATLKTSKKGHAYVQIPLLVSNGCDLLGYPAQEVVRLVAFEGPARSLAKTLRKGATVRAEGAIRFQRWNDKEGFQRTCLAVIALKVEKLGEPETKPGIFGGRQHKPSQKKNLAALMLAAAG
jgi:single-stranded DNA-binding protein